MKKIIKKKLENITKKLRKILKKRVFINSNYRKKI